MPNSKLTQWLSDSSIISYFLHAHAYSPGQTPKSFYLWSIVNAIAAIVTNKYYFCKFPGKPMIPNIYTFLVAPSGVGKGTAIFAASDYLMPYKPFIRMFTGRATHSAFMKFLTAPQGPVLAEDGTIIHPNENGNGVASTPGFLVTEELGWCLGKGDRAAEFIRLMTAIYAQSGREFEEMTQQYGYHTMHNACINWIAGSTKEWLLDSIGVSNLLSGFASRIIWIMEEDDPKKMTAWPVMPPNFREIQEYIAYRMSVLYHSQGCELVLAPAARFAIDRWFAGWKERNELERDKGLKPLYARGHDLALKLATLLRVADMDMTDKDRHVIRQEEMEQAILWVEDLMMNHYKKLLDIAYKSGDKEVGDTDEVAAIIKSFRAGECTRSALTKRAHNHGMNARIVEIGLKSLMEQKKVEMLPGPGGRGGIFHWLEEESVRNKLIRENLPRGLH
ncbi:MAG: hypothetical protein WC390_08525 [Sulfurimonas sp.]|jgi:hypothetical protein